MKDAGMNALAVRRIATVTTATLVLLVSAAFATQTRAEAADPEIEALKAEIAELRRRDEEHRKSIEALNAQVERLTQQQRSNAAVESAGARRPAGTAPTTAAAGKETSGASAAAQTPQQALDAALAETAPAPAAQPATATASTTGDVWSRDVGGANLRLLDISMDALVAAGFSSVDSESELGELQGGAHDPSNQGFTLQQAELSFTGAVDPYFTGEAHVVASPDEVELEEAFLTTSALPYGLQLEAGYFLTEFGRMNPTHPHQWEWLDQPVVNTRMFGGEGLRSPGFRLGWLTPLPWSSELHFGMQNADEDDVTASFISGEPVGGRPSVGRDVDGPSELLYLARWTNSWEVSPATTTLLGVSGLHGPNDTGNDGETWIYGLDFTLKWRPPSNFRGGPFVVWQTEAIGRDFTADSFVAGTAVGDDSDEFTEDLPKDHLKDYGLYTQVLYGFRPRWAGGARFEYASGDGPSTIDGTLGERSDDSTRADRFRFSPLLAWYPTHFSRLRLQYNLDWADQLDDTEHTVWLGAEILYGAHAAHNF